MKTHWKLMILCCVVAMQSSLLRATSTTITAARDDSPEFRIPIDAYRRRPPRGPVADSFSNRNAFNNGMDGNNNNAAAVVEQTRRQQQQLSSFPLDDIDEEESEEYELLQEEDTRSLADDVPAVPSTTKMHTTAIAPPVDFPPVDLRLPTPRDIQDPIILSSLASDVDLPEDTSSSQPESPPVQQQQQQEEHRSQPPLLTRQPTIIDARRLDQSEEGRRKRDITNQLKVAAYQPRPDHDTLGLQLDFKQGAIDAFLGFAVDFFFLGEGRWDDIFQMTLPKSFTDIGIPFNLGHLDITELTIRELERPNVYKIDLKQDGFHVHVGGAEVQASMTLGHRWRKESERFFLSSEGTVRSNVEFTTVFVPIVAEVDPEDLRDRRKGNSRLTSHTSTAYLQRLAAKDRMSRDESRASLLLGSDEEELDTNASNSMAALTSAPVQLQLIPLQPNFLFENGLLWQIKRQDFLPRIVNKLLNGRLNQMLANVLQDLIVDQISKHLPAIIGDFVHVMVRSLFDWLEGLLQGAPDNLVEKTTNVLKLENPSVKISDGRFSIATGMHIDFGKQDVSPDQDEIRQWFYTRPPLHWNHGRDRQKPVMLMEDPASGFCKESKYARMSWWKRVWRPWTWFRRYPTMCQDEQERREESTIKQELSRMPKTLGVSKEARRVMDCVNRYCAWFFKWQTSEVSSSKESESSDGEDRVDNKWEKLRSYQLDRFDKVEDVDGSLDSDDAMEFAQGYSSKPLSHQLNMDDYFDDDHITDANVDPRRGDDGEDGRRQDDARRLYKRSLFQHHHRRRVVTQQKRQRMERQAIECRFVDALFSHDFADIDMTGVVVHYDAKK